MITLGPSVEIDVVGGTFPHAAFVGKHRQAHGLLLSLRRGKAGGKACVITELYPMQASKFKGPHVRDLQVEIGKNNYREGLSVMRDAVIAALTEIAGDPAVGTLNEDGVQDVAGDLSSVRNKVLDIIDELCREAERDQRQLITDGKRLTVQIVLDDNDSVVHRLSLLQQYATEHRLAEPLICRVDGEACSVGEAVQMINTDGNWRMQLSGQALVHISDYRSAEWLSQEGVVPVIEEDWKEELAEGIVGELMEETRYAEAHPEDLREFALDLTGDRLWEAAFLYGGCRGHEGAAFSVTTLCELLRERASIQSSQGEEKVASALLTTIVYFEKLCKGVVLWKPWNDMVQLLSTHARDLENPDAEELHDGRIGVMIMHALEESVKEDTLDVVKTLTVSLGALQGRQDARALEKALRTGRKTNVRVCVLAESKAELAPYLDHIECLYATDPTDLLDDAEEFAGLPEEGHALHGGMVRMGSDDSIRQVEPWFTENNFERALAQWEGTL